MAYAVGDCVPVGPFEWVACVNGTLCGSAVSYSWEFSPAEGAANRPPEVLQLGQFAVVRARLQSGSMLPEAVSPGVLTLAATVTTADGRVVALEPITLTLTADGVERPCA